MPYEERTYSSRETAEQQLGVSVGWLRIAERLGALPLARCKASEWRYHMKEDIHRLRRLGIGDRKRRLAASHE